MADLDDELAALEKEIENENKNSGGNQSKFSSNQNSNSNMNMNFGNSNAPKQSNYSNYGNNSDGLDNFLNNNNNYGNNNYQNNNFNNYNNNNNNYNQCGNNNNYNNYNNNNYNNYNNYNNQYNNFNNNFNNYNNNQNQYNNPYNNNYNNNNYNNFNNNNNRNNSNQQMNRQSFKNNANMNMNNMNRQNQNYQNAKQNQMQYNQNSAQAQQMSKQTQQMSKPPQQMLKPSQQQPKQSSQQPEQMQSKINQSKKPETSGEPQEDIYPEKQENMYHKVEEMKSLTVLEEEIALCNKIMAFKKKRGLDYDAWETKKDMAEVKLNSTKALIEGGQMDFEGYKKLILKELQYEKKILKFTEMDKKSKPYELKEIKRRIEQRIEVINKELTQNVDDEGNDEEQNEEKKEAKNEPNNQNNQKIQQLNKSQNKMQQPQQPANPKMNLPGPEDSEPRAKTTLIQPNKNQFQHQNQNIHNPQTQIQQKIPSHNAQNIPPQYIIQKKVLVTDPKTGKQMYVMKNVVDPRYEQMLKQNEMHQKKNKTQVLQPQNQAQNPHFIQQKVLVTDPKTGKQMYVMKNVPDPRYAQPQGQAPAPKNQTNNMNAKTAVQHHQNQAEMKKRVEQGGGTQVLHAQNKNAKPAQQPQPQPQSNNEEIQKYKQYINALIKEYTEAKEYFKKCGFEKQLGKSREDLKILVSAKQKVDMGRYKDVKLNALPKPVTPEYIFGYNENERMEKFKLILSQYIKDKNEIEHKMKSILEKLQKLKRKELEKAKDAVKPKLDELKTKKEQIIKIMDALKEKFKDKWTPAPEFKKVAQQEQVEKISFEGCKYGLKIKADKTDYDKDKTSLVLLLEVNKSKTLKKEVKLKQDGDFNEEWVWEFTADEWKNIPKTFLYVDLFREHTFSTDKKGSGKIDLNNIRRGTTIKNDCKIEIESKRVEPIVNFVITPILPEGKKHYETVTKEVIKITKTFPAFTGKQHIQFDNPKPSPSAPATNAPATHHGQNSKQTEKVKGNAPATGGGNAPIIDKSKFKPEELEDVDILDNLNSLKVLDYKIKELEMKIKKIDGRTPREMLQKKIKMNCKKKQLEEGMGDGSISPKDYMEFMRIQLEHDQLLALYMKQNNQEEKMKAVLARVNLLKQEMEELKKYAS